MNKQMTILDLKRIIEHYPDECLVLFDTNPLNGGSFENLELCKDNDGPLEFPRALYFTSNKGY